MALVNTKWYLWMSVGSSYGWKDVTIWSGGVQKNVGDLVRSNTLANMRVFICVVAGTTAASEPTWVLTKGAKTEEAGGPTWQECTGQPAVNGDVINTPAWAAGNTALLGQVIKNTAGTHYFIADAAITTGGGEPSWDTTVGNLTADSAGNWRCLGAVGNFAAWGAPGGWINALLAAGWVAAGDTIYISASTWEQQSSNYQITFPGTATNPNYLLCVDTATVPPTTLVATAVIDVTNAFTTQTMTMRGFAYIYGVNFWVGGMSYQGNAYVGDTTYACGFVLDNCLLKLNNTNTSSRLRLGTAASATMRDSYVELINCTLQFGSTSQTVLLGGVIKHCNTVLAGSVPTTLFTTVNYVPVFMEVAGSDLSALGSGKNLVSVAGLTYGRINFRNCKLGASVVVTTGSFAAPNNLVVNLENCDSADPSGACRLERYDYQGQSANDTSKYRIGGATNDVIPISLSMYASTAVGIDSPATRSEPIYAWNEVIGQITVAIEFVRSSSTARYTSELIWLEVEYLGVSGYPQSLFISSRPAKLASAPLLDLTDSVWANVLSSRPSQKVSCTFTVAEKGLICARVCHCLLAQTFNIDPRLVIT